MKEHPRAAFLVHQGFNSETKQWKDIREGIKLRDIVQSKRMNDVRLDLSGPGTQTSKLIIQRHLGHKTLIPGAAQWGIYT